MSVRRDTPVPPYNGNDTQSIISQLQHDLKQAIREERYEDAAKIRDEIKGLGGDVK